MYTCYDVTMLRCYDVTMFTFDKYKYVKIKNLISLCKKLDRCIIIVLNNILVICVSEIKKIKICIKLVQTEVNIVTYVHDNDNHYQKHRKKQKKFLKKANKTLDIDNLIGYNKDNKGRV